MIPYKHSNDFLTTIRMKESDRRVQRQKNIWLQKILIDPNHPLSSFVNRNARSWITSDLNSVFCVQTGNLASRSSGATEYLALEMALINQSTNKAGLERRGQALLKTAIRMGDIPVERSPRLNGSIRD